jgi:EAL domain-containing protein (putative c-di-GMP-specific phosphodiesterase class I)
VENEKVFEMLKLFGVDLVQGYLLDMPSEFPQVVAQAG